MSQHNARHLDGLSKLDERPKALLCDVWGVVHNGQRVYEGAVEALSRFREAGGLVVLITNSPRPRAGVKQQLADIGAPESAYDEIVTSGDVTRDLIAAADGPVYHLGPNRDLGLFDGLGVDLVAAEAAEAIVCTGLVDDETETPDDYRERLEAFAERGLPFICANPDIVVERGDRLIWCAGALARLYDELGGETRVAGKPHDPIYQLAHRTVNEMADREIAKSELLAIGDGMPTDVKGAQDYGAPLLYIAGGIHNRDYGGNGSIDETALQKFLKDEGATPDFWMERLVW